MKIYLDVCCLNRPFDDQMQERIHLESEAVLGILEYCQSGSWWLMSSEAIEEEISRIPDEEKRERVKILCRHARVKVKIDSFTEKRALELEESGFNAFDALHLACAEHGKADIFLTTDDQLLHRALLNKRILKVRVENPIKWLMEVLIK
jgi:predicted nucleic acid-binding protein